MKCGWTIVQSLKNQTTTCLHPEGTFLVPSYKGIAILTVQKGCLKLFNLEHWSAGWLIWCP